jgi:hypothetical protein
MDRISKTTQLRIMEITRVRLLQRLESDIKSRIQSVAEHAAVVPDDNSEAVEAALRAEPTTLEAIQEQRRLTVDANRSRGVVSLPSEDALSHLLVRTRHHTNVFGPHRDKMNTKWY